MQGQRNAAGPQRRFRRSRRGVLREAFAEGRLTAEEHSARVGQAYSARTYAELATVSADLSAEPPAILPPQPASGLAPGPMAAHRRTNSLAVAALVCSVIPGLPQLAAIVLGAGRSGRSAAPASAVRRWPRRDWRWP